MKEDEREFLSILGYFLLQNGKGEKALSIFRALNELFPDDPYLLKSLSYACIMCGKYEKALHFTDKFLGRASEARDIETGTLLRGKSLWGIGRKDEARGTLRQYLDLRKKFNAAEPR
jgi:tetratricopeptide (TPR) repeat protein